MRRINLIAANGKYVCAEEGGGIAHPNIAVRANRDVPGAWEEWKEEPVIGGVTLKTINGNYLSTDGSGNLSTDLTTPNSKAIWTPVNSGYKSPYGKFLCAEILTSTIPCIANRDIQGAWETFTIKNLDFSLLRVVRDGNNRFMLENGKDFKWMFGSNFMLHQRVAEGQDIRSVLYPGFNGYRVFGSMHWIPSQVNLPDFDPDNYPNWGNSLELLADILADNGSYFQYNVLCDRQYLPGGLDKMRNMVGIVNEISKTKKNMICALGNENPKNGFNANDFQKPTGGALWCTGSGLGGGPAPLSNGRAWDYQCQHLRRDEKMFIDIPPVEAPTYHLNHLLLHDETIGFADFDSNSRSSRIDWAFQCGTVARGWYGIVQHLHSGVHSLPLGVREDECRQWFLKGIVGDW